MHRSLARLACAALLVVAARTATAQTRDTSDTFNWKGDIPAGSWIRVVNLNGSIDVDAAEGSTTQVEGRKEWRHGDPDRVRFTVLKDGTNVTICALWGDDDSCDAQGYHGHHGDGNNGDISVRFTVRLPKGVQVAVQTVNGSVDVAGATSGVEAHTVNGRVDATSSGGPVRAGSVNGSVHARMAKIPANGDLDYESVNGTVTVELPASLDADVELSTVNGAVRTDYPMTVSGRLDPKHIRGTVGKGGLRLRVKTVNGSVELQKLG
ncbi:MAG TPA: DUF4097 family beta strand repeat-containing protein [Gemmatimonadaceae bacterium]|nr:DUF4097 family beta strand repeat-containing protein [Gemmatimonadaceae bacterium]